MGFHRLRQDTGLTAPAGHKAQRIHGHQKPGKLRGSKLRGNAAGAAPLLLRRVTRRQGARQRA